MKRAARKLLIVDGYNVLNAWKSGLDAQSLADGRDALALKLTDYAGFSGQEIILVFDAWLSDRMQRTEEKKGLLTVVFTQKNETADHYIERLCDNLAHDMEYGKVEVRVATSDNVEQTVVFGRGAIRISSRELLYEMDQVRRQGREGAKKTQSSHTTLIERLPEETRRRLEEMFKKG